MHVSFLLVNFTMMIFFGWYAFLNPDVTQTGLFYPDYVNVATDVRVNCWAADKIESNGTLSANVVLVKESYTPPLPEFRSNETAKFLSWFMWGFIFAATLVVSSIVGIVGIYTKNLTLNGVSLLCIACVQNLGFVVWVIFGSMIRFNYKG